MNPGFYQKFSAAPLELKIYILFSLVVIILDFTLTSVGPKQLKEAVIPFTGWMASMFYMFSLIPAFLLVFTKSPRWPQLHGIIALLVLQIINGLLDMVSRPANNYGNPYLTVSPWRPVWTVVVPALWILILFSPRMRRFGKVPEKRPSA